MAPAGHWSSVPSLSPTSAAEQDETPDLYGAYPRLSEQQIALLRPCASVRSTQPGEVLFRDGDRGCDFFVVLSGTVAVVDGYGTPHEHVVSVHGARRFLGEISLLIGQAVFVTAVVQQPGEVLQVPMDRLRALVTENRALGDLILRACIIRRSLLIEMGAGIKVVGSRYSADARRLLEFLARNQVPHRWFDVEEDSEAETLLQQFGVGAEETPLVVFGTNRVLRNPTLAELARVVGLAAPTSRTALADLAIVGAGPAGLAAAVYGASDGLSAVVIEAIAAGGQAGTSSRIENYLGFPAGISGGELAERAVIQAERFGAHITVPAEGVALEQRGGDHVVRLGDDADVVARSVLIATGVHYRRLDVPRLDEFEGTSVHYAATEVEARVCAGDVLAIVGGGNSAGQAALFLSRRAARAHLVIRDSELTTSMSRYLADRIERQQNVQIWRRTEVRELVGGSHLEGIVVQNNGTGETETIDARYLFVFIGAEPRAQWLGDQVLLDGQGFVCTGPTVARDGEWDAIGRRPLMLETSRPGVFAAGDIRSGSVKRVAAAAGEGAMAVRLIYEHLSHAGVRADH